MMPNCLFIVMRMSAVITDAFITDVGPPSDSVIQKLVFTILISLFLTEFVSVAFLAVP